MATTRSAQVVLAKDPDTGKPMATIYTPTDVTLAEIGVLQGKLFGDIFKKNGKAPRPQVLRRLPVRFGQAAH